MRGIVTGLVTGVLFGVGLAVSGMTQPAKVRAFLDVGGAWDASLLFVMGGAVLVYGVAFRVIQRRSVPLLAEAFSLPTRRDLDGPLLAGAVLFGVGWGLAGYCPGPGIVAAGAGELSGITFLISLWVGMKAQQIYQTRQALPEPAVVKVEHGG